MDDLDATAEWLLAENPEWPQPVDPFDGLERAERATGDRDWTLS